MFLRRPSQPLIAAAFLTAGLIASRPAAGQG
jgi:hypothetical protein